MTELRLDSRSIDSIQLSTYEAVCRIATACEVPFVIVGASARDIDIAIQLSDWSAFETMCDNLTKEGHSKTDAPHRLMSSRGIPLDIAGLSHAEFSWLLDVLGLHLKHTKAKRIFLFIQKYLTENQLLISFWMGTGLDGHWLRNGAWPTAIHRDRGRWQRHLHLLRVHPNRGKANTFFSPILGIMRSS